MGCEALELAVNCLYQTEATVIKRKDDEQSSVAYRPEFIRQRISCISISFRRQLMRRHGVDCVTAASAAHHNQTQLSTVRLQGRIQSLSLAGAEPMSSAPPLPSPPFLPSRPFPPFPILPFPFPSLSSLPFPSP